MDEAGDFRTPRSVKNAILRSAAVFVLTALMATAQVNQPGTLASPNPVFTLKEALARSHIYGIQIQYANIATLLAREDRRQAVAASLPSLSALNQFVYTQGNGTPSGVFVANDGVHIYNQQAVLHEEVLSLVRRGQIRAAAAGVAIARARTSIAARGLDLTVIQDYYAIASAKRRLVNVHASLHEAENFFRITQEQERAGEVAHADTIKAQIQVVQRQRDVQDASLNVDKGKITLSILIFPGVQLGYDIVDDLNKVSALPPLEEASSQVTATNPTLEAARQTVTQTRLGVNVAKYAFLPSLALDFFYGIDANQYAIHSRNIQATGRAVFPNFLVENRKNLGYSAAATLTIPIWTWGAIRSRVKQASLREQQAKLDLTLSNKQLQASLAGFYKEAQTALSQIDTLRLSNDLSGESLRLTLLRYKSGEATALEVVDAQTTATLARNAYSDGLLRYRLALASLQNLTGNY